MPFRGHTRKSPSLVSTTATSQATASELLGARHPLLKERIKVLSSKWGKRTKDLAVA